MFSFKVWINGGWAGSGQAIATLTDLCWLFGLKVSQHEVSTCPKLRRCALFAILSMQMDGKHYWNALH